MAARDLTPRQEEVLDEALVLVRESGLQGLTVRRLAERVGFSEAALYRHFASKRELLVAMSDRMTERRLLAPIRRLVSESGDPVERLEAVLSHHVSTILETDAFPILLLAEAAASGDEELLGLIARTMDEVLARLEDLLAELRLDENRPSCSELALLLFGLPAAVALRHRLGPDPEVEEAARGRLVGYLVRQLVTAPVRSTATETEITEDDDDRDRS